MRSNDSSRFIRLTDAGQWDKPKHLLVNVDHIRRVEAVARRGEYGDRVRLVLHLAGEAEPVTVSAVDQHGRNTVLERSEDEVLSNFHAVLDAHAVGEQSSSENVDVPDTPADVPVRSRRISRPRRWADQGRRW